VGCSAKTLTSYAFFFSCRSWRKAFSLSKIPCLLKQDFLTLEDGKYTCPETSVKDYNSMLRNIPEEHWSQDCRCCAPRSSSQNLSRPSLILKRHTVSHYVRKCNLIYARNRRMASLRCFDGTHKFSTELYLDLLFWNSPKSKNKCGKNGQEFIYISKTCMAFTGPTFTKPTINQ
jgi:hypothetical protein